MNVFQFHPTHQPNRRWITLFAANSLVILIFAFGAGLSTLSADWKDALLFRSDASKSDDQDDEPRAAEPGTRLDTRFVGDYVTAFGGTTAIEVHGVGLVNGLDGTGEDPPPSFYRTALVEEMRRLKIEDPNQILAMPTTAMVLVKAYIPVNSKKGDPFDVEVTLPPNSEATSLAGGTLFTTRLAEEKVIAGRRLEGKILATAEGPILISTISDGPIDLSATRRGKVLGGGKSRIDRDLAMGLRNEYRSGRNSRRVADAIGRRFHGHDRNGIKIPMAEAKTDQQILLRVPQEYDLNTPRYINVIRNIATNETDITRRVRMQTLEQQLAIPEESERAALRLEAIGSEANWALKRGLLNKSLEVRFNAAMALTYMGKTDGLEALGDAAEKIPAFRIYAFAALASCRDAEAAVVLKKLTHNKIDEVRYGAFRALTEMNERDPFVRGEPIQGNYKLHVITTEGPPLVHITNHTRAEVVLFGSEQQIMTPVTLRAGQHIMIVANSGSDSVSVSRFSGRQAGERKVSRNLAEIILACDQLGASYPDIVAMLTQANRQHNLSGNFAIDALPVAGREYIPEDGSGGKRRIGSEYMAPNIYAPSADDAARSQREDLAEISPEEAPEEPASEIQTVSNEMPAPDQTDGEPSKLEGVEDAEEMPAPEATEVEPPISNEQPKRAWYDVRRLFKRSEKKDAPTEDMPVAPTGDAPPGQSEPE